MEVTAKEWERHRPYLLGVAYRLLGSLAEAEDAVQEAYLRLDGADGAAPSDLRGWLVTVVSRICLDQLRSARVRREAYVGPWLPEPIVGAWEDEPADRVTLAESVQMALLVVLQSLSPAERTAFVLHDVFGYDFPDVGEIVGRSPAACRQLASRARTHVRDRTPRFDTDPGEVSRVVTAFLDAAARGDLASLVTLLDPDVELRTDGGGIVPAARRPVLGADAVARLLLGLTRLYAGGSVRAVRVNGAPGVVLERDGAVLGVAAVAVAGHRLKAIDIVVNPDKLRHLDDATWRSAPAWRLP